MAKRPLILISNDDGIAAPGIAALVESVQSLGDIVVVAPDRERSAASHSISLDRPLRVDTLAEGRYAVNGTPVDCVYLGLLHLVPRTPDLCISGINAGFNLGSDVFYSGTVAAAVEAALRGVPAMAVSLQRHDKPNYRPAAELARALAAEALDRGPRAIPQGALLNINCPTGLLGQYEITFLGRRVYRDQVEVRSDLRGRAYYWIGGPEEHAEDVPGSDMSAIRAGHASVTPLGLDMTHRLLLKDLQNWDVRDFVQKAVAHGAEGA
ncbi:MAG: 5'/3'-nucleotidase SurE [Deltaproteobacteria bacterium]|nr:5'/3'-nucleotidase SurE [Deltaproteobacteria bacterium]